jgi:hypothetical protein
MMTTGKDSAEVVKFLSLDTRLKDWCDDERDAILQRRAGRDLSTRNHVLRCRQ